MSDQQQDRDAKTEDASPKKLQDAIDKGNTPFSRELVSLASVFTAGLLVVFASSSIGLELATLLSSFLERPADFRFVVSGDAQQLLLSVGLSVAALLTPILLVVAISGFAASAVQNPIRLVGERVKPTVSRIALTKGFERIFGAQGRFEFLKALFKLGVVTSIALVLLADYRELTITAYNSDPSVLPLTLRDLLSSLFLAVAAAFVALAIGDFLWSRHKWRFDLRMTRKEVKDEFKQMEGDPAVKARLKSLARDRARRRMISAIPKATVVITNPTHLAIALRYVRGEDIAPLVLAKGADLVALRIRQIAEDHRIPLVEDRELARSLYKAVEIDRPIPVHFYQAVAKVIMFIMSQDSRRRKLVR